MRSVALRLAWSNLRRAIRLRVRNSHYRQRARPATDDGTDDTPLINCGSSNNTRVAVSFFRIRKHAEVEFAGRRTELTYVLNGSV